MIKYRETAIKTPSIKELFHKTDRLRGISLFSASTEEDREVTGFNPVIILTEKELKIGGRILPVTDHMKELDKLIAEYSYLPEPLSLMGYISYDFKDRFEEKGLYEKRELNLFPDFYFVLFEHYLQSSRDNRQSKLYTLDFPFAYQSIEYRPEVPAKINPDLDKASRYKGTSLDKPAYEKAVAATVDYIRAGDIYQANITRAIYGETDFTPLESALALYRSNRISYGVFAAVPGGHVISTSPELFFKTDNGKITASPIKGTIARSKNPARDLKNKEELLHSEKNIAELAMIVDLLRNDLSHICRPGTVIVPEFPILMTLENVYHLYADINGDILPGKGIGEILKKTFPGGSITGCPKIRACQIIDELESSPRGIYTGSFGKISFNGSSIFNIMIRSLFQRGSDIIFNVGGGITLLSDPEEEYEETIHKGTNIWKAMKMEEISEEQYCTED